MTNYDSVPLIALDFEMAGCDPKKHYPVSAGVAVRLNRKITKHLIKFPLPEFPTSTEDNKNIDWKNFKSNGWEERCINEFWSKQPSDLLLKMKHPDSGTEKATILFKNREMARFIQWLRSIIESMPEEPILLTDNGVYDWPIANFWIHDFCIREDENIDEEKEYSSDDNSEQFARPLSYSKKWGYMTTLDVGDFLRPFNRELVKKAVRMNAEFVHSHVPDDDAANMINKFQIAVGLTKQMGDLQELIFNRYFASLKPNFESIWSINGVYALDECKRVSRLLQQQKEEGEWLSQLDMTKLAQQLQKQDETYISSKDHNFVWKLLIPIDPKFSCTKLVAGKLHVPDKFKKEIRNLLEEWIKVRKISMNSITWKYLPQHIEVIINVNTLEQGHALALEDFGNISFYVEL
jgi:hypothetical protein